MLAIQKGRSKPSRISVRRWGRGMVARRDDTRGEGAWSGRKFLSERDAATHEEEEGGGETGGGDGEREIEGDFAFGGGGRLRGQRARLAEVGEGEEEAESQADGAGDAVVEDEVGAD